MVYAEEELKMIEMNKKEKEKKVIDATVESFKQNMQNKSSLPIVFVIYGNIQ